ncbi:MAG: hypothetical protein ACI4QW_04805, partial [Clostridia bacterium]
LLICRHLYAIMIISLYAVLKYNRCISSVIMPIFVLSVNILFTETKKLTDYKNPPTSQNISFNILTKNRS